MVLYEKKRVVIVGGGIAGLSTAWAIRQRAPTVEVVVLERGTRTGGNIRTDHIDGYVCEAGPDGFLDNAPATRALVHELGLDPRVLPSNDDARRRYIFSRGHLRQVPTSIGAFVTTPLLSARGKLRLLVEPFAHPRQIDDESILEFATRRIGREAAEVFVNPMVSGVYAGDASALSLKACFPRMRQIEDEHGGLVRGLVATRRARRKTDVPGAPAGRLTSFVGGMGDLIDGLTRALGSAIRTSVEVAAVRNNHALPLPAHRQPPRRFAVRAARETLDADAIILTSPAAQSAAMVRELDPTLAGVLDEIPTAPLAVVCMGYEEAAIRSAARLDGFGFLTARGEGIRILGTLWETSIYDHRAPRGRALLRVMIGGASDPGAVSLSDDRLLTIVREDLKRTMNISAMPELVRIVRHPRGIPQYTQGHQSRVQRIDTRLKSHPGLFVAGNSFRGVSLNACVADARSVADAVLTFVSTTNAATEAAVGAGNGRPVLRLV